ncbi:hypothetical protein BDW22DRAFT_679829 [Trametopsis cervina]|nr:hypothetical protein BDW22DRAFT_679829 [Trametopsis cervina]
MRVTMSHPLPDFDSTLAHVPILVLVLALVPAHVLVPALALSLVLFLALSLFLFLDLVPVPVLGPSLSRVLGPFRLDRWIQAHRQYCAIASRRSGSLSTQTQIGTLDSDHASTSAFTCICQGAQQRRTMLVILYTPLLAHLPFLPHLLSLLAVQLRPQLLREYDHAVKVRHGTGTRPWNCRLPRLSCLPLDLTDACCAKGPGRGGRMISTCKEGLAILFDLRP